MSKVTKKDLNERLLMVETLLGLHRMLPEQISMDKANDAIFRMQCAVSRGKELAEHEQKPQLKVLDQSIFDGLDEKWRFAAVDSDTSVYTYEARQHIEDNRYWVSDFGMQKYIGTGYDTSDWQNSLIERDIAKELLEIDLSSELTGSELCKAMLVRGDKYVMCLVSDSSQEDTLLDGYSAAISSITYNECFYGYDFTWLYATPINNQGEPLTQAEAGL